MQNQVLALLMDRLMPNPLMGLPPDPPMVRTLTNLQMGIIPSLLMEQVPDLQMVRALSLPVEQVRDQQILSLPVEQVPDLPIIQADQQIPIRIVEEEAEEGVEELRVDLEVVVEEDDN